MAYLAFTAGYAPASGPDAVRVELAGEALRLVRVLLAARPDEPVLRALLALELLQHSRRDARVAADGTLVLLPDQDRGRWRHDEIDEARTLLAGSRPTRPPCRRWPRRTSCRPASPRSTPPRPPPGRRAGR